MYIWCTARNDHLYISYNTQFISHASIFDLKYFILLYNLPVHLFPNKPFHHCCAIYTCIMTQSLKFPAHNFHFPSTHSFKLCYHPCYLPFSATSAVTITLVNFFSATITIILVNFFSATSAVSSSNSYEFTLFYCYQAQSSTHQSSYYLPLPQHSLRCQAVIVTLHMPGITPST